MPVRYTLDPTMPGRSLSLFAHEATCQAHAWLRGHLRCVGCEGRSSHWSPTGVRAVHTASGPGGRCRKGLEPSRHLSETTGPRSPSAFRVVFPATEVTKRGARRKRPAAFFTHRAPEPVAGRFVTLAHECCLTCSSEQSGAAHMFPQRRDGRCKRRCSRRWLSIHSLPRARERKAHTLLRRQPRDGERWRGRSRGQPCEARCRTRRRSRLHGSRQSCRHDGGRAVRMPVRGEAGTGDASGATAARRCDARGRRSRPGRARREAAASTARSAGESIDQHAAGSEGIPARRCPRRRTGS